MINSKPLLFILRERFYLKNTQWHSGTCRVKDQQRFYADNNKQSKLKKKLKCATTGLFFCKRFKTGVSKSPCIIRF